MRPRVNVIAKSFAQFFLLFLFLSGCAHGVKSKSVFVYQGEWNEVLPPSAERSIIPLELTVDSSACPSWQSGNLALATDASMVGSLPVAQLKHRIMFSKRAPRLLVNLTAYHFTHGGLGERIYVCPFNKQDALVDLNDCILGFELPLQPQVGMNPPLPVKVMISAADCHFQSSPPPEVFPGDLGCE